MAPSKNGFQLMQELLRQSRVVRFPRHRLATFGACEIHYDLVTALSSAPTKSHVRSGRVYAERPKILTPESFAQRFEGFGEESQSYERFFKDQFHESLRGLEYNFRNQLDQTLVHHTDARELARNIQQELDARDAGRSAVIVGPEAGWGFALMKFILEETSQSFAVNLREMEERGLFNPDHRDDQHRREIEFLFTRAEADPFLMKSLAERLHNYHLFDEYQDRFFSLVKRNTP